MRHDSGRDVIVKVSNTRRMPNEFTDSDEHACEDYPKKSKRQGANSNGPAGQGVR